MEILGHKNIKSTLIYINLEAVIFATNTDEFHVKVVKNIEEIAKLLEIGLEYVCEHNGDKIFRKRK